MYVAVKGGERAIDNAHRLLAQKRRGDPAVPELTLEQISEQLALAVDRVMAEGSLYDRELAALGIDVGEVPGYGTQATGHLQVAAAITAGLADVGVASEPAALAYGLAFIPLATERFDLVIPADLVGTREVQGLIKVLSSRWLLDQLASLPGYDPARCGEHVATLPPSNGRGAS